MARLPRFVIPGQPQHVIQRGNNREVIFASNEDYHFYLEKLQDACHKYHCDVHAYVLMTNHVHLLLTPNKENGISKVMQSLGKYYVQYFNYTYERTGTLWLLLRIPALATLEHPCSSGRPLQGDYN